MPKYKIGDRLLYQNKRYRLTITNIKEYSYWYTYIDLWDPSHEESGEIYYNIDSFEKMDNLHLSLKHILNKL